MHNKLTAATQGWKSINSALTVIGLFISVSIFAQTDSTSQQTEDELLQEQYKWKLVKSDTSTWLVIVAPYSSTTQKGLRGTLTIMVNKKPNSERPPKLIIVFGEKLNQKQVLDLHFYLDKENDSEKDINLSVTETNKTGVFSIFTSVNGFGTDLITGQPIDLFQLFSSYDILSMEFSVKRDRKKSYVPIKWFRSQYAEP